MATEGTVASILSVAGLGEKEARALGEFRERLARVVSPEQVYSLVLFGSRARGEAGEGSDADLLVVLDEPTPEQLEAVQHIAFELVDEGVDLMALTRPLWSALLQDRPGGCQIQRVVQESPQRSPGGRLQPGQRFQ